MYSAFVRYLFILRGKADKYQNRVLPGSSHEYRSRSDFAFSRLSFCLRCLELRRGTQIEELQRGTIISHGEKTFAVLRRYKRWSFLVRLSIRRTKMERYNNLSGLFSPCVYNRANYLHF